jgi:hypothetical protein
MPRAVRNSRKFSPSIIFTLRLLMRIFLSAIFRTRMLILFILSIREIFVKYYLSLTYSKKGASHPPQLLRDDWYLFYVTTGVNALLTAFSAGNKFAPGFTCLLILVTISNC